MGALAPLVRVALDQPESGPLGPRPGDYHSPLVTTTRLLLSYVVVRKDQPLLGFL